MKADAGRRDAKAPESTEIASRRLERLETMAGEAGDEGLVGEAREERQRLADARFFVACVGQSKRGKSTLLNALVGRAVLPVGVTPVTSVVTVLRHGEAEAAHVQLRGGSRERIGLDQVPTCVDERQNPGNRRNVAAVEISLPAEVLRNGLCLVDTPGLGSIIAENTAATETFLPHVDVALLVVGPDPPLSGVELDMLAELAGEVTSTLVVLNKADRVSADQQAEIVGFTRSAIESRLGRAPERIFAVSALERLNGVAETRDWPALVRQLHDLSRHGRRALLAAAAARVVRRLGRRLLDELRAHEAALRRPLADTEARLSRLRSALADVDRSLRDLRYLFDATEANLAERFEQQRVEFVRGAQPGLDDHVRRWIDHRLKDRGRRSLRGAALVEARRLAEEVVGRWLTETEPAADDLYRTATARFADITADFLARIAGDSGVAVLDDAEVSPGFELRRQYYFASLMHETALGPLTWLGDLLATRDRLERRVTQAALTYLHRLLRVNSYRVENDFKERTRESRRRMERHLRARLAEAVAAAERALSLASAKQQMDEVEVRSRLDRLTQACEEVSGLASGV